MHPKTKARTPSNHEPHVWLLAAGDAGGDVTIYNIQSDTMLARCRGGHYQVFAVTFSPDGATLASGGRGPVKLWDVASGKPLLDIPSGSDYIKGLDFSPDGRRLAVGCQGAYYPTNVSVWSIDYGRGIQTLRGLASQISKVSFSADGKRIAALSHRWEVGVWDIATSQLLKMVEVPQGFIADNAAFALSPKGERLAFASGTTATIWDVQSGHVLDSWELPEGLADVMAFPDVNRFLLFRVETLNGGSFNERHPRDNPLVCRIRTPLQSQATKPAIEIRDFNAHVFNAAVTPDGQYFVAEGIQADEMGSRVLVKALDSSTGRELWSIPSTKGIGSAALIADAANHYIIQDVDPAGETSDDELLAVHEALDKLAAQDARTAELVKLRYFAGLTFQEAAQVLDISVPTAKRWWAYARGWLLNEIKS